MDSIQKETLMEAIQFQREKLLTLSNSVKMLLGSTELVDNFRKTKLDVSLLTKLKRTLVDLQDLLYYANKKLIPSQANNKSLNFLTRAVFEVANLLDESHSLRYDDKQNKTNSRLSFFIALIKSKTDNLIQILQGSSSRKQLGDDESSLYGRDADIQKLIHLLLSSSSDGDAKTRVISIVGMGGIGKTALAKHLYNHLQVNAKFELKLWADFSTDIDDFSVFENILQSITSQTTTSNDTSTIYPKFLLVLDGVWDARSVNWTLLIDILNAGKTGSRVVVTTRDERVAISMHTFLFVYYLRPLKVKDCWTLLVEHAFGAHYYHQRSYLEKIVAFKKEMQQEIGRKIAERCDGLPLAAVEHGAILCISSDPNVWKYVLESHAWETTYEVLDSLKLSYNFLSDPLKQCFQYCSIFPKKSILEKKMVVQLWIAAGLLESSSTDLEKVGEEYFDELVSRSLIHRRSIGDDERNFGMHNFIHDLATEVSSPDCINMNKHNLLDRMQNFSYKRGTYDSYDKFDKLYRLKGLRTFLAFPLQEQLPLSLLSNKVVHDLLPKMKQLRMLSLSSYKSITKVPKSIGNLLDLRYLNLSHTSIERLPSETCKLYHLQFLLLANCKRFTGLPEDMGKLINLRYLDVRNTALREMPVQIAKLENLHTLSDFVISKHNGGLNIADLGKLPHLHGKLSISQLQNVNDPFEVDRANIKMREKIDELSLEWDCGSTFQDSQIHSVVLEHLQPSTNLKSLTIKGYGGINFPNWLGDISFSNMVYLKISNCSDCLWLPPLGQLGHLKELFIEVMQSVQRIGIEFYGSDNSSFQPFPSLETLHFEDMQEWDEWNLNGGSTTKFPSLKTLTLSKCPKLRIGKIPEKFPSLTNLELRECPYLVQSMPSSKYILKQLMFPLNSLQQLTIDGFSSLMSFPTEDSSQKSLLALRSLKIWDCNELESFPPGGLATLNLIYFAVWKCEKLPSLPEAMLNLINLQEMEIDNLPNLQSFVIDDLPYTLRELTVGSVGGIMWNIEPTWERLTCLSVLRINGDDTVHTLMRPLLPASLVTLCIRGLNDTSVDGMWFQHLNSLQNLEIVNAPKLKSLPKGLTSSLSVLSITRCPLLVATLRRKRGKEWRKIARIPAILIDDELIT